ncbi:MAG TPA: SRPBCC family protein [Solirubrobacteraceae bacterium]|nr:SRPBCC family protein [Solirubrobacteraceae bacterium]
MPTASRSRTIAAPLQGLWELVCDPHHLPRWWPRVERVEDVADGAFTEVMRTEKGKLVRADFQLLSSDERSHSLTWEQQLEGTPFERLLSEARTHVSLREQGEAGTDVTIELHQRLTGFFPRFGGFMVKGAAGRTLEEALDGLERVSV